MGNLGAQKEKRNDTPISAKKDIMGDKTVRVRADLHHIIKIETAKNGGNIKEVMKIRLRSKLKSVLIVHIMYQPWQMPPSIRASEPNISECQIFYMI